MDRYPILPTERDKVLACPNRASVLVLLQSVQRGSKLGTLAKLEVRMSGCSHRAEIDVKEGQVRPQGPPQCERGLKNALVRI